MKNPTPNDGCRCRFSDEFVKRYSKDEIRGALELSFGTICGDDGRGNWLVLWDGAEDEVTCKFDSIEIGPVPGGLKTTEDVERVFEVAALKAGLARNTRRTYAGTIEEFSGLLKSGKIAGPQGYFDYLATVKKLAPNTVWHALNPLKFLYEKVLWKEFGTFDLPKRNRSKPLRSVIRMEEVAAMMARMDRLPRLQTGLLAGTGMRIESDMLQLRLKDIRIKDRVITVFEAKGGKSRALAIPKAVVTDLEIQMEACWKLWERDRAKKVIYPHPQESLMAKLSRNTLGTLPWCWLFPSRTLHGDERWHATDRRLVAALREAAVAEKVYQRVNPHALRHSYASGLLGDGVDVKVIQEQLGHTSLETTSLYLHTTGARTVASPLDRVIKPATDNTIPFRRHA